MTERAWRRFWGSPRVRPAAAALIAALLLSLLAPALVSDRAWWVSYDGTWSFPIVEDPYPASRFSQDGIGEARYRELDLALQADPDRGWVWLAPYPYGPLGSNLDEVGVGGAPPDGPTLRHWMGTDNRGRDVFARLVFGLRTSLLFGAGVVIVAFAGGITAGAVLGWFGGWVDLVGQRFIEIWSVLPALYVLIIVGSLLPSGPLRLGILLALFGWTGIAAYVRGEVLRERSRPYVEAAIAAGERLPVVLLRHVVPNALGPVVALAPFAWIGAISSLVALDYLGFGLPAPTPSWGELARQALEDPTEWHLVLFPFGTMFVTLTALAFVGEAARDALDPTTQPRRRPTALHGARVEGGTGAP
jgi:microcin C transport system permease protein